MQTDLVLLCQADPPDVRAIEFDTIAHLVSPERCVFEQLETARNLVLQLAAAFLEDARAAPLVCRVVRRFAAHFPEDDADTGAELGAIVEAIIALPALPGVPLLVEPRAAAVQVLRRVPAAACAAALAAAVT
jgi:hypothetical protein